MTERDVIEPFTFEELPIRGQVVHLQNSWQAILGDHDYPATGASVLGEMVVIAAMLANSVKLDGSVVLQALGDGELHTAMTECTDRTTLRGILRYRDPGPSASVGKASVGKDSPLGTGQLAITLRPARGEPYQGRVELSDGPFAGSVERYFDQSEQLPTCIRVASSVERVVGVLVQRLPSDEQGAAWAPIARRTQSLTAGQLLAGSTPALLRQTYAHEVIRLHASRRLEFGCSCSNDRAAAALRAIGVAEVESLIAERQAIEVTCEFCAAQYAYDPIDARLVFETHPGHSDNDRIH